MSKSTKPKQKPGPRRLPPGETRDRNIILRVNAAEEAAIKANAERHQMPVAMFVRRLATGELEAKKNG